MINASAIISQVESSHTGSIDLMNFDKHMFWKICQGMREELLLKRATC